MRGVLFFIYLLTIPMAHGLASQLDKMSQSIDQYRVHYPKSVRKKWQKNPNYGHRLLCENLLFSELLNRKNKIHLTWLYRSLPSNKKRDLNFLLGSYKVAIDKQKTTKKNILTSLQGSLKLRAVLPYQHKKLKYYFNECESLFLGAQTCQAIDSCWALSQRLSILIKNI